MKTQKRRGLLAKAGALLAVAALAFSASPSYAEGNPGQIPATSDVVITKLEQPASAGAQPDGTSETVTGGIEGVTFDAYPVPIYKTGDAGDVHTHLTSDWQRAIAGIDLGTAQSRIASVTPTTLGTTGEGGVLEWDNAPAGLYLIRESSTPEGVVGSGDFLLAVPMTNPDTPSEWLSTIYVYPKADTQGPGSMTVANATDYAVGDTVTWTVNAEIPQIRDPYTGDFIPTNRFEIWDTLTNAELALATENPIRVSIGETVLSGPGSDKAYEVVLDEEGAPTGETIVKIVFTTEGRAALVEALKNATVEGVTPPVLNLTVEIDTKVQSVGEFDNDVTVYPGNASVDTDDEANAYTIDSPVIKYGNITLVKEDTNANPAPGAVFRVYASRADALEKNDKHLKTVSNTAGEWRTVTKDGKATVLLDGFRFSDFANGANQAKGAEGSRYQTYYLVEMTAPAGQQLLAEPMDFTIESFDGSKELEVTNTANTNAFVLPLTGGSGTALLTILGLGILAIVLFVARSRRNAEA